MKQKKLNKRLVLNKETITNLTKEEQLSIRAGGTVQGRTCDRESEGVGACD